MSINTLTLADVAEIEEKSGQTLASLADTSAPKGKLMQSIAYVLKRKENPKFTYEDAGKMSMEDMNALLEANPI